MESEPDDFDHINMLHMMPVDVNDIINNKKCMEF